MKVENVELIGSPAYPVEHPQVIDERVLDLAVEPQGVIATRFQHRGRLRIAAREQRHLVSVPNQLVGDVGDDPLGATVEPRRTAFVERRNLRDFHDLEHPL